MCPPCLQILLGIVKKHDDLTERDLHEVDLEIARAIEMSKAKLDNTLFHNYFRNLRSHRKIRNELGYLANYRDCDAAIMSNKEISDLDSRIRKLKSKLKTQAPKLNIYKGSLISEIQLILKKHHKIPQAYHSLCKYVCASVGYRGSMYKHTTLCSCADFLFIYGFTSVSPLYRSYHDREFYGQRKPVHTVGQGSVL